MGCFAFTSSNLGTLAMDHMAPIAGTASSVQGVIGLSGGRNRLPDRRTVRRHRYALSLAPRPARSAVHADRPDRAEATVRADPIDSGAEIPLRARGSRLDALSPALSRWERGEGQAIPPVQVVVVGRRRPSAPRRLPWSAAHRVLDPLATSGFPRGKQGKSRRRQADRERDLRQDRGSRRGADGRRRPRRRRH